MVSELKINQISTCGYNKREDMRDDNQLLLLYNRDESTTKASGTQGTQLSAPVNKSGALHSVLKKRKKKKQSVKLQVLAVRVKWAVDFKGALRRQANKNSDEWQAWTRMDFKAKLSLAIALHKNPQICKHV